MSKISAIDFANYVNSQRKYLIRDLKDKKLYAEDNMSLGDAVVYACSNIHENTPEEPTEGHEVRYFDIDGTLLKTEYVQDGEAATPPETPTYDSENLEFVRWLHTSPNLTNITRDTDCGAYYRCKNYTFAEGYTTRPTIIKFSITPTSGYDVTVRGYAARTPTGGGGRLLMYIDWGDGSDKSISTATNANTTWNVTHTYSTTGEYTVRVGFFVESTNSNTYELSSYCVGPASSSTNYLLGNATLDRTITVFYDQSFNRSSWNGAISNEVNSLKVLLLSETFFNDRSVADVSYSSYYPPNTFLGMYSIQAIFIPYNSNSKLVTTDWTKTCAIIGSSSMPNLHCAILEYGIINTGTYVCVNTRCCTKLVLPDTIKYIQKNAFSNNTPGFNKLILPSSLEFLGSSAITCDYNMRKPMHITIPITLNHFSYRALQGLPITSLVLPAGCTIGFKNTSGISTTEGYEFNSLYNLETLTIPASMKSFGGDTLTNCYSLKSVYFLSDDVTLGNHTFGQCLSLELVDMSACTTNLTFGTSISAQFSGTVIKTLRLPVDMHNNVPINSLTQLTKESKIDIVSKLKDLTNESSKIVSVNTAQNVELDNIFVNDNYEEVSRETVGALSLKQCIYNKNWTITISTAYQS